MSELYHWKYIKREKINGEWRYWYDNKKNLSKKSVTEYVSDKLDSVIEETTWHAKEVRNKLFRISMQTNKIAADMERVTYDVLDKGADFIEKYVELPEQESGDPLPTLQKKTNPMTKSEDMAACNPNYSSGGVYKVNCVSCVMAYDLRRRGYDVEAMAIDTRKGTVGSFFAQRGFYKGETIVTFEDIIGSKKARLTNPKAAVRQLTDSILENGDGSRGMLEIWRKKGSGHVLIWEVDDGSVVIRDPQNNTIVDLMVYMKVAASFDYFRTDNLELTKKAGRLVKNRKAGEK